MKFKRTNCECRACKLACEKHPCWPTPEQGERLREAHPDKVVVDTSTWLGSKPVRIVRPAAVGEIAGQEYRMAASGRCVFFEGGRCALHYTDLKPLEGRLWSHELTRKQSRTLHSQIASMWIDPAMKPR